ncbi:MAG: Dipeptide transport system permease protein DppB [Chlamydiae bacterium]|nr:Dipeptide transport system permease protein DppB [Chlamydiota bacterium]
MLNYIIRRLFLLPITLFFIILVNFTIINLAPGDSTTITEISQEGLASREEERSVAFGTDDRYLQFREHYGLTLPVLINLWPFTSQDSVNTTLWQLTHRKESSEDLEEMFFKEYDRLRITFGDKSKFIMPQLLTVIENSTQDDNIRWMATRFFVRGGTRQAHLGPRLTEEQKKYNRKIARDNNFLNAFIMRRTESYEDIDANAKKLREWYEKNKSFYSFEPNFGTKLLQLFETRFFRYMRRVLTLDFGTLRNDSTKTVINEVTKRFKYSLTLAIIPLLITFFFSQFFGFIMAYRQNRWQDLSLNVVFLVLYAIPVFVVAPFLIENVALNRYFPFTDVPIPISGFTSPESIYSQMNTKERLFDVIQHIFLPLVAIMYGSLAATARLSRTAVLEVLRQDYVRTARAKGVSQPNILFKHVGRNAAITIVTSIAGSLGIVLGGSLIVETLFEINGFGKFFYDAVINRDYNVIMFSALAGSFLTLLGYLMADIAYTLLDPRVTLE